MSTTHKEHGSIAAWTQAAGCAARLLLAAAVCAGFAAMGSAVVVIFELLQGAGDLPFLLRTAVKAGAFGLLTALLLAGVWRLTRSTRPSEWFDPSTAARRSHSWVGLAIALLIGAGIAFPRLNDMPRAEPDEMHHLIVAKNLGLEGKYASGTADAGFVYFDSYDSVGMPVIGAAAMAIRHGGVDVGPPRRVIAVYFLLLIASAYALLMPAFGGGTAAFGVALLALAPMSPYLARTVYGEVPGLAWVLTGLVLWRASWGSRYSWLWGVLAGAAFGCAVLCKAYLVLFALPAAAAWLFDYWTHRRVPFKTLVAVTAGGGIILAAWVAFTFVHGEPAASDGGTLGTYRHLLLFGLGSVTNALAWFTERPLVTTGLLIAALAPAWLVARERHDPALLSAWMFAIFVVFWFCFFTPGHIPRYLWYGVALISMFFGPAVVAIGAWSDRLAEEGRVNGAFKGLVAIVLFVLLLPSGGRNALEMNRMMMQEEVQAQRDVARYVALLPPDATVSTAHWPLERVTAFYNGVALPRVSADRSEDYILDRVGGELFPSLSEQGAHYFRPFDDNLLRASRQFDAIGGTGRPIIPIHSGYIVFGPLQP